MREIEKGPNGDVGCADIPETPSAIWHVQFTRCFRSRKPRQGRARREEDSGEWPVASARMLSARVRAHDKDLEQPSDGVQTCTNHHRQPLLLLQCVH